MRFFYLFGYISYLFGFRNCITFVFIVLKVFMVVDVGTRNTKYQIFKLFQENKS